VLSFDHEARLRSRHREALAQRLVAGSPANVAPALARALEEVRSSAPLTRADAYARLAVLLADPVVGEPADVYAWLRDSAAVESDLSVVANLRAEARADLERRARARTTRDALAARLTAEAAAQHAPRVSSAIALVGDDDPARRMEGYRALLSLADDRTQAPSRIASLRFYALLQSEVRYDVARLKREPELRDALLFVDPERSIAEQPYLDGAAELVSQPVVTSISAPLRALQQARQTIFAVRHLAAAIASLPAAIPDAAGTGAAPEIDLARREYDASLHRSGIDQVAISAGAVTGTAASVEPALVLGGALYDEHLGDHRRFGFPSDTAFVVGRTELWLGRDKGSAVPTPLAWEARALGYRSLRLPLSESDAGHWPLGWEMFVDLRGNRARAVATEARAGWGLLAPLFDRDELANHVLASIDFAYAGFFPTPSAPASDRPQTLAAPLALEVRSTLGARPAYRHWVAARVSAEPALVFAGAPRRLVVETAAQGEAHLALGASSNKAKHDPTLLVRASVLRTSLSLAGARVETHVFLNLGIELR
jgi:hypothetical protein